MHAILLQAKGARWVIVGLRKSRGWPRGWWQSLCRGQGYGRGEVFNKKLE